MSESLSKRGLKGRLLDNSIEAYILALETINRLSIKYRTETFCFLICNAWELLLKSRLIQESRTPHSIYYPKERGQTRRTLSLRACLRNIFTDERDPVRRNIEFTADIRDEATHLIIGNVPPNVMMLFQACVLNYHQYLQSWWHVSISDRVPLGMMALTYDLSPAAFDFNSSAIRRQFGKDTVLYLMRLQTDIENEFESLGRVNEFSIDVDHKLALVKKPKNADITLSTGSDGEPTLALQTPKDTSTTHPFREMDVLERLNNDLDCEREINGYDVRSVVKKYKIKVNGDFFHQVKVQGFSPQYSRKFIDWVIRKFREDDNFFQDARDWVLHNERK